VISEKLAQQNMDNLKVFCEGESQEITLYNGCDLEQLVKELMENDSTLTLEAAWELSYKQAEQ